MSSHPRVQPVAIVECRSSTACQHLGARVSYPAASLAFQRVAVWVLDGRLTFHEGDAVHELDPGDSIEVDEPVAHVFANTSDAECRYAIILTRVDSP